MADITVRETITGNLSERPDPDYFTSCRVCGSTVSDWRRHKGWHEKHGDAVERPAPATQD